MVQVPQLHEALLFLVPERKRNILQPMRIRDARDSVLAPSVCPRPCGVVREVWEEGTPIRK